MRAPGSATARTCASSAPGCSAGCAGSLELGRRLAALDLLDEPRDVFYLEVRRAPGLRRGPRHHHRPARAGGGAAGGVRRATRAQPAPADASRPAAWSTWAMTFTATAADGPRPEGDRCTGIGCCPGIVRGPVRVDPRSRGTTGSAQGEILVAERTDPGWIMLFPSAAGLLVERGSLLSHSAIVARELGIPAIVALAGVTALAQGRGLGRDGRQRPAPWSSALTTRSRCRGACMRRRCTRRRSPADFSIVRYAQCWEDADVLLEAWMSSPATSACPSPPAATTRWRC